MTSSKILIEITEIRNYLVPINLVKNIKCLFYCSIIEKNIRLFLLAYSNKQLRGYFSFSLS